jgi:hypothetical protein
MILHAMAIERCFAMLVAYLDESGIHDGAAVCVIAGYFASRGPWQRFETDWKKLLYRFGVPMEKFHACDLFPKPRKFFSSQSFSKNPTDFLEAIAATIARHKYIHPICGCIQVGDFRAFPLNVRQYLTGANVNGKGKVSSSGNPNKPYFMPFQKCVVRLCQYAPKGGKAHFAFGLDRPFAKYAMALFKQMAAPSPNRGPQAMMLTERLGTPTFPMAKETAPLQIADVLVNLTYHHLLNNGIGAAPSAVLAQCTKNAKDREEDFFFINRDIMEVTLQLARETH